MAVDPNLSEIHPILPKRSLPDDATAGLITVGFDGILPAIRSVSRENAAERQCDNGDANTNLFPVQHKSLRGNFSSAGDEHTICGFAVHIERWEAFGCVNRIALTCSSTGSTRAGSLAL
jgi:hypothetical protein